MMMCGEGGGESEFDEEAAWETYYEWAPTQCWGPTCEDAGDVQFARLVAKLEELGLPIQAGPPGE